MVVGVEGVVNAGSDLASADHLLQGDQHQLDRQEGHALVEEVEGAVKDQVPVREEQTLSSLVILPARNNHEQHPNLPYFLFLPNVTHSSCRSS